MLQLLLYHEIGGVSKKVGQNLEVPRKWHIFVARNRKDYGYMEDNGIDIRWIQRLENYQKALIKLTQAVNIMASRKNVDAELDELLKEGLIQRFEYTHELAWNVMKDYAEYQGYTDIRGSRDAIRKALEMGLIDDARWMETIGDRNLTSHNYDDETAEEVYLTIVETYYPLLKKFEQMMLSLRQQ